MVGRTTITFLAGMVAALAAERIRPLNRVWLGIALGLLATAPPEALSRALRDLWLLRPPREDVSVAIPPYPVRPEALQELVGRGQYAWHPQDQEWFVTVPGFDGAWATGATQEEARRELESVLQDWISLAKWRGQPLPSFLEIDAVSAQGS